MTFKEKLTQEHPDKIDVSKWAGCEGCPNTYDYEEKQPDFCSPSRNVCEVCWNREIPGTEKEQRPHDTRYDDMANDFRDAFDSLLNVGFTEDQAAGFINSVLMGNGYNSNEMSLRVNGRTIRVPKKHIK